jgi:hypothetical protein
MPITDAVGVVGTIIMVVMVLLGWLSSVHEDGRSFLSRYRKHIAFAIAG